MNIGSAAGLVLLLMNCMVNAEDTISSFIRDMMTTFHLSSPTIVYDGDEVPEICYTDQWVLCVSSQAEKSDENVFEYNTKSNESTIEGECLTSEGPSSGERCIFPFLWTWRGKTFNACTLEGHHGAAKINGEPWCSTKVDENGAHIPGNWGRCGQTCPVEEGCNCIFPFTYQGIIHSACTEHDSLKITGLRIPWCSTVVDDLGNHVQSPWGNWASCSQKCPFEMGNELVDNIAMLHDKGKQDSFFHMGIDSEREFVGQLQHLVPELFQSESPAFLPLEYSSIVKLRLDSNIIFYEQHGESGFNLVDKFAVNGGVPIVLELGSWGKKTGYHNKKSLNRWDRRTDLMGATFVNTLWDSGTSAYFQYNDSGTITTDATTNGTISGSGGSLQEQLFYITDWLNLTIETKSETRIIDGISRDIFCEDLLDQGLTDICSGGIAISDTYLDWIITESPNKFKYTLFARVETENTLDVWVFVNVFGLSQWLAFVSVLLLISLLMIFSLASLEEGSKSHLLIDQVAMTFLFIIQQGSHPTKTHLVKRVISLTLSMVTLLVFVYYANDITAKMTAGSKGHPVKSFEDVLPGGYRIIVVDGFGRALGLLASAKNNTAKHAVYKVFFEEDYKIIEKWDQLMFAGKYEEADEIIFPSWHEATSDWAENEVMKDKKTLWYCNNQCATSAIQDGRIIALPMNDAVKDYNGHYLSANSEYVPVFKHYVLKAFETGIFPRIELEEPEKACIARYNEVCRSWMRPAIKVGMTEPSPLGITNVMFLFSLLGGGFILSSGIAMVERVHQVKPMSNEVSLREVLSSRTSEVGVQSPEKSFVQDNIETIQDEVDIMVDAIQLRK